MGVHREHVLPAERLARGLGWFGIALGAAELMAPRQLARAVGAREDGRTLRLLRAYGAREIALGAAILSRPTGAQGLWWRVAGDAVDLASLGSIFATPGTRPRRTAAAGAAAFGVAALDLLAARTLPRAGPFTTRTRAVHVEQSITINRPIEEVYRFWTDFQNFPRFMRHVEEVRVEDDGRTRWRVRGPAGTTIEWTAEIVEARDAEYLAWRAVEGSGVRHAGAVVFTPAPGARGTEVSVALDYEPPAGRVGRWVARLRGRSPEQQLREDLRRFKQLMETGGIAMSDAPSFRGAAQPHAARERAGVPDEVPR